jgi:DNA ligase (NAD+)
MNDASIRINRLREEIRHHEYLYFTLGTPQITDQEFDLLMHELKQLELQHPWLITADSPTQRVGESVTSFNSITHRVPMMSIDNSYSANDLAEWLNRLEKLAGRNVFPVVAELKIDGVSGSFHYRDGQLIAGATRGNGIEGDLVTENVKTIRSLPLAIKSNFDMDLRGEIFIARSTLEQLNRQRSDKGEELFKNCRNLTSGTIKSLIRQLLHQETCRRWCMALLRRENLDSNAIQKLLNFLDSRDSS